MMKYTALLPALTFLALHLSAQHSAGGFLLGTDTQVVGQTPTGTRSCVLLPLQDCSNSPSETTPGRSVFFKEKLVQVPQIKFAPPPSRMGTGIALGAVAGFFTGLVVGLVLEKKDPPCSQPNCIRVGPPGGGLLLGLVGILPGAAMGGFIGAWPRNENGKAIGD